MKYEAHQQKPLSSERCIEQTCFIECLNFFISFEADVSGRLILR